MKEEVTYLWEKTEDAWSCPSCLRKKNDCQVVGKNGKVLKILVEHHDHMRDYVKQYV